MNDDIRGTLARALPESTPSPRIDLDIVERQGERLARRRRFGFAGMATAGVAVVAAVVVAIPLALGGGGGSPAATGNNRYSSLPELDPDKFYTWRVEDPERNEETKELTTAFWEELSKKFPDLEVADPNAEISGDEAPPLLEPGDYPDIVDNEHELYVHAEDPMSGAGMGEPVGFSTPVYGLSPYEGKYGGISVRLNDDAKFFDELDIAVHPEGSYADGPKSSPGQPGNGTQTPHLAAGCEDGTETDDGKKIRDYEFDCETTTGPGGEKIYQIRTTVTDRDGKPDLDSRRENTVIVTLGNGDAVVINDLVNRREKGGESGTGYAKPTMDFEDLIALALALPEADFE